MKIVIQRCKRAQVTVSNETVGAINKGLLLLVCMEKGDDVDLKKVTEKVLNLRVFTDPDNGKMNLNIKQVAGEILCVSQFTLSWDGKKGNRPSFDNSMDPKMAQEKFDLFCDYLKKEVPVSQGFFGTHMEVELINDGPVTFSLNF